MVDSSALRCALAAPAMVRSPFLVSFEVRSCDGGERCEDMVAYRALLDAGPSPASVQFGPADHLIVVTDGVPNVRDQQSIPFGSSSVVGAALQATADGEGVPYSLIDAARRHGVSALDDRAAVVVTHPYFR